MELKFDLTGRRAQTRQRNHGFPFPQSKTLIKAFPVCQAGR